ncbi:kinase-like domain-containing protein [Rhizophagus clarus]|uniref:Kinase-like domain-containing protein n=1 Tax=Rhizophagus clarus TaxID=94130 RepID=A0A8H3KW49_9GLOM|nr:kinase-like domain-containing protein [Rhizophagus clarus]
MSYSNNKLINNTLCRSFALIDYNIHNNIHKQYEFRKQIILNKESLKENEKSEAIKIITKTYDLNKLILNSGTIRICEICNQECLATTYSKGGFSEIYTATWVDGYFIEWDYGKQQLKRFGNQAVVLKKLRNVENANQNWLEEARPHLTISNKWPEVVQCYGLTQEPSNGNYMLVMNIMEIDLKKYLQQNHNQLTWKEKIQIAVDIIYAVSKIHNENAIHRDLHSGNILCKIGEKFFMSDLGFCGPADKPLKSIYGNLPYIAPEFKINEINLSYQNESNDSSAQQKENNSLKIGNYNSSSKLFTSKLYHFDNLPEPRNATEEEQEVTNHIIFIFLMIHKANIKYDSIQDDYKIETMRQQNLKHYINDNDEDERYNNLNINLEEQDKLEPPYNAE